MKKSTKQLQNLQDLQAKVRSMLGMLDTLVDCAYDQLDAYNPIDILAHKSIVAAYDELSDACDYLARRIVQFEIRDLHKRMS